jgi:hypothetical protein
MLELIFLLYILPKRMTQLARARNRSAIVWSLAAIGAWIGAEISLGVTIVVTALITSELWGWPKSLDGLSFIAYIPGLIAALIASELVKRRLESLPVAEANRTGAQLNR